MTMRGLQPGERCAHCGHVGMALDSTAAMQPAYDHGPDPVFMAALKRGDHLKWMEGDPEPTTANAFSPEYRAYTLALCNQAALWRAEWENISAIAKGLAEDRDLWKAKAFSNPILFSLECRMNERDMQMRIAEQERERANTAEAKLSAINAALKCDYDVIAESLGENEWERGFEACHRVVARTLADFDKKAAKEKKP